MKPIILALLLSGCASLPVGMEITEAERAACEAQGRSVWTLDELRVLINKAMQKGYEAGKGSI